MLCLLSSIIPSHYSMFPIIFSVPSLKHKYLIVTWTDAYPEQKMNLLVSSR